MTFFIGGNSHVTALKIGAECDQDYRDRFKFVNFGSAQRTVKRFSTISEGRTVFITREARGGLKKGTDKHYFDNADTWSVCVGNWTQFMLKDPIWKDAVPAENWAGTKRPVSKGLLDKIVLGHQRWIQHFVQNLKNTGVHPLFVFPPPYRQDQIVAQNFPENLAAYLNKRSIDAMSEWLEKNKVEYVLPPTEALDSLGLLKPEYSKKINNRGTLDTYHATPEYGALVMAQISDWRWLDSSNKSMSN